VQLRVVRRITAPQRNSRGKTFGYK